MNAAGRAARAKKPDADLDRTFFDDLRRVINSKWLVAIFIVFLLAALMGMAVSIYYRMTGQRGPMSQVTNVFFGKEGVVANAPNVNLRNEPWGDVMAVLPEGTRVRVIDSRDKWVRVRVVEWKGLPPQNAPDGGWLDGRYLQFD